MLRELVMVVAADDAEAFGDALLAAGALAVTVEDAQADTPEEAALYDEPGAEPERNAGRIEPSFTEEGVGKLVGQRAIDAGEVVRGDAP